MRQSEELDRACALTFFISKLLDSKKVSDHHAIIPTVEIAIRDLLFKTSGKNITKLGFKEYENKLKRRFASIVNDKNDEDDDTTNSPLPVIYEGTGH